MHYFTFLPTVSGLGDQLIQYKQMYVLSQALKLHFICPPMSWQRIFPDIGEFVGIESYSSNFRTLELTDFVDLSMHDILVIYNEITCPTEGANIRVSYDYSALEVIKFINSVSSAYESFPFESLYRRKLSERLNYFASKESDYLVVMHLRLGDRAEIPFNGGVIYLHQAGHLVYEKRDPKISLARVKSVINHLSKNKAVTFCILTDGLDRFKERGAKLIDKLDAVSIADFFSAIENFDSDIKRLLIESRGVVCVGEDAESTKVSIDAISNADLIIRSDGSFAWTIATFLGGAKWSQVVDFFDPNILNLLDSKMPDFGNQYSEV